MLALPVIAAAQGGYGRDPYYRNGRGNDNYYRSNVRDAIQRVEKRSDNFENRIDRALDRSRYDGTRREERINNVADQFEKAADRLKDRYDDGRNLSRTEGEVRQLLQLASRLDSFLSRNRIDSRLQSDWNQIRQDLNVIANAYNINRGYNDGYRNDDNNRRNRRNNRRGSYNPYGY